jgi:proline racemase
LNGVATSGIFSSVNEICERHESNEIHMKNLLGFSVREDVRLEICGLGEFLVATVEGTHIRSIAGVNANVSAAKKIQNCKLRHQQIAINRLP